MLSVKGETLVDLAEVLTAGGRSDQARDALEQALALFEQKGNVVMAGRTRSRLETLREPTKGWASQA
jgi:Flp pilus assembly protein TadD